MAKSKLIVAIETVSLRGKGTEDSPMREVRQYFSAEGALLAEYDAHNVVAQINAGVETGHGGRYDGDGL